MYFSSFGSKDLFLGKIVEVINSSSAKIKKYLKKIVQDKSRYFLDENLEDLIIAHKLFFKVGFKFTKKNSIDAQILKTLSEYNI